MKKEVQLLIPPDPLRCQTEWLGGSFMTLGPRQMERCKSEPTVIAFEKKPDEHGRCGGMSLCDEHLQVFQKREPERYADCTIWRRV